MNETHNSEYLTFFRDWLPLDKKDFRILAMLAEKTEFKGNLSELCDYFSLNRQTHNTRQLRESIQKLTEQGFITCENTGRTYTLRPIPRGNEIEISRRWAEPIIQHKYNSESVAWEIVLKVYIWISDHHSILVTNADIATDLHISTDAITYAKNVLERELGAITREIEKITLADGSKRNRGQWLGAIAEWSE